jgi:ISXO2 transposase-like protein
MMHRLRYAMKQGPLAELMKGVVEVDETYVGARNKRGTKRGRPGPDSHKTPVRRARWAPVRPRARVHDGARDCWQPAGSDSHERTPRRADDDDDFGAYRIIGLKNHQTVNHRDGEYVRGDVYTNTAEGFFSLLKRGINGVYHHVSRGHLNRYCDEFSFRYENRKENDGERAARLVAGAEGKRLTYKQPATS